MQFLKTHTGIVILCGVLVVALIGGLAYAFSDAPAAPSLKQILLPPPRMR